MSQSESFLPVILNFLRQKIIITPRRWKRAIMICLDILLLLTALWGAYAIRLSDWTPEFTAERLMLGVFAPLVAIPIFIRMGMYRAVIRYLPEAAIWTILRAILIATMSWVILIFLLEMAGQGIVPRSVPFLYFVLSVLLIGGSRFAAKWLLVYGTGLRRDEEPVFIYGADSSAVQLANALQGHGSRFVIGLIDDDPSNQGRDIGGYRAFPSTDIVGLIERYGIREIIISLSSIDAGARLSIISRITGLGVKVRSIPNISDIVDGRYIVNRIREIEIDELLGRSLVPADANLLSEALTGKTVLVTGAGGSIGSELCRLITAWRPNKLILLEANEYALYQIDQELKKLGEPLIIPILGSVTNERLVRRTIRNHNVEVVYHAAAYKHVPLLEKNIIQGIYNNVFGTLNIVKVAAEENVGSFVLISSDKAVRPANVMGATKRWAEMVVRREALEARSRFSAQKFSVVRFGNVIGSNGSVVPLFKKQILMGGPVTVTDPDMTRYFMSIPEAAELIVQAGALSVNGDVFLLDMGEPVRIGELAANMIRLAGFKVRDRKNPNDGIAIDVIGKRPGEKLFEELFYDRDSVSPTHHPKIMRADSGSITRYDLTKELSVLRHALEQEDDDKAKLILFKTISDATHP